MPRPLVNRFVHLDLDFQEWKSWAYETKIDSRIISFLSYKPQNLFTFNTKAKEKSFATPRSWSYVNDILNSNLQTEFLKDIICGAIGKESADEFMNFWKVVDKLPSIEELINTQSKEVLSNNSILYA